MKRRYQLLARTGKAAARPAASIALRPVKTAAIGAAAVAGVAAAGTAAAVYAARRRRRDLNGAVVLVTGDPVASAWPSPPSSPQPAATW